MTHRRLEERVRAVTESLHRKYGPVSASLLKAVRTAILSGILDGHEGAAARVAAAHDPLITAILADYRAGVLSASAEAVPIISGFTEALRSQGVRDARAGLTSAGITPATAAEVVRARVDDGPLHRLLVARAGQHADRVGDALVDGVARGAGPVDVSRALRVAAEGPFRNAVLVARTEGLRAYRESTLSVYKASPVVTQWRWSCRNSERSCGACVALDGEVFDTDQPMEVHPACFVAGTVVSGEKPTAATSRRYTGRLVKVVTGLGHDFTGTPNHPILTDRGWVPLGELAHGDNVVSGTGEVTRELGDADEYQRPTPIGEVFRALSGTGGVRAVRVPASSEHFHGDGAGGDVNVVWPDRQLRHTCDTPCGEEFCECNLGGALVTDHGLPGEGTSGQAIFGEFPSAIRGVGSFGHLSDLLGGAASVGGVLLLGGGPFGDTVLPEYPVDGGPFHSVAVGEFQDGDSGVVGIADGSGVAGYPGSGPEGHSSLGETPGDRVYGYAIPSSEVLHRVAGKVVLDQVVQVDVFDSSCHVYNLQTPSNIYCVGGGVIAHNCMCTMTPVVPDFDPGPSGAEQLAGWDPEVQDRVLGPAMGAAYRDGVIDLSDLPVATSHPEWGGGLRTASLTELVGAERAAGYVAAVRAGF